MKWAIGAVAVILAVLFAWGWGKRDGRVQNEGALRAAEARTDSANARADSIEALRAAGELKHSADSARLANERDHAVALSNAAARARRDAEARMNAAAQAVDAAVREVLASAGDSATVSERLARLVALINTERAQSADERAAANRQIAALERTITVLDTTLTAERAATAREREGRLAERAAKEAAQAQITALEATRPGWIERTARKALPVVVFLAGIKVGQLIG